MGCRLLAVCALNSLLHALRVAFVVVVVWIVVLALLAAACCSDAVYWLIGS